MNRPTALRPAVSPARDGHGGPGDKTSGPNRCRSGPLVLAEDGGFEPPRAVNPTRVPGVRHRPLGESSSCSLFASGYQNTEVFPICRIGRSCRPTLLLVSILSVSVKFVSTDAAPQPRR